MEKINVAETACNDFVNHYKKRNFRNAIAIARFTDNSHIVREYDCNLNHTNSYEFVNADNESEKQTIVFSHGTNESNCLSIVPNRYYEAHALALNAEKYACFKKNMCFADISFSNKQFYISVPMELCKDLQVPCDSEIEHLKWKFKKQLVFKYENQCYERALDALILILERFGIDLKSDKEKAEEKAEEIIVDGKCEEVKEVPLLEKKAEEKAEEKKTA